LTVPSHFYSQAGVVALRPRGDAGREILLVTSRGGKRWVIPKGVIDIGSTAPEAALQEAWEEGGVRGRLSPTPIGGYRYRKWGGTCSVEVYLLEVDEESLSWPEDHLRRRRWLPPRSAADLVREKGLSEILLRLAQ